jgi:hypothetical protein
MKSTGGFKVKTPLLFLLIAKSLFLEELNCPRPQRCQDLSDPTDPIGVSGCRTSITVATQTAAIRLKRVPDQRLAPSPELRPPLSFDLCATCRVRLGAFRKVGTL